MKNNQLLRGLDSMDDMLDEHFGNDKAVRIGAARMGQPSNHLGKPRPWKGQPSKRKGIKHTEEVCEKIKAGLAARTDEEKQQQIAKIKEGRKGQTSWNKGIPMPDQTRERISASKKNKPRRTAFKPCCTEYGVYPSVNAAIIAHTELGLKNVVNKLAWGLKQAQPGYAYISQEEYIMLTGLDPFGDAE